MTVDLGFAQRLDLTEGAANAEFVEARKRLDPQTTSTWIEVAEAYAMFDGIGSPTTQTFGLGLRTQPKDEHMDQLERFFTERGASTAHDVSPLAGVALYRMLVDRGYKPVENAQVLYMNLAERPSAADTRVQVRIVRGDEIDLWARVAAEAWIAELPEMKDMLTAFMRVSAHRRAPSFLAEIDGEPVAAAGYFQREGVALLAGAATIPRWRKQGAQRALLDARLQYAAENGCDIAMMCAEPGSTSQRNAERSGFRIAYTRTKWERHIQ